MTLMRTTQTRLLGALMGTTLALGSAFVTSTSHAASDGAAPVAEQQTHKQVAEVKIEIRQETGKVVKNVATVDWNQNAEVVFEAEEQKHDLDVKLVREGDKSRKVSVTMAYSRDGQAVIAPYSFDTTVKKREVIRIEGGLAIAVTVTPKKVKVEKPKDETPDVDIGEGNDPLSGL